MWNIGTWANHVLYKYDGCNVDYKEDNIIKFKDSNGNIHNCTFNHKFNLNNALETFEQYKQRLTNIVTAIKEIMDANPNTIVLLQEMPPEHDVYGYHFGTYEDQKKN